MQVVALHRVKNPILNFNPHPVLQQKMNVEIMKEKIVQNKKLYENVEYSMQCVVSTARRVNHSYTGFAERMATTSERETYDLPYYGSSRKNLAALLQPTRCSSQILKVFHPRGKKLDYDDLYKVFGMPHERIVSDFSKLWPQCCIHTRHF